MMNYQQTQALTVLMVLFSALYYITNSFIPLMGLLAAATYCCFINKTLLKRKKIKIDNKVNEDENRRSRKRS